MSFIVIYIKHSGNRSQEVWHINQQKPVLSPFAEVTKFIADGDELELIRLEFDNVPMPANGKIVTWHGDFARFLYANIITPLK